MVNRTVLISGAGIGGHALAFWLARHGFAPTVVEVAPGPRPGGHAVDLRGAGRDVVERMGLLDKVRAERVDERGFAYVDGRGRWTARMPSDLFGGEGMVAEIEIMRGNLTRILYDASRDDTEYLFDDRITGLAEDGDGVKVTFASGTVRRFDIVVGADGLHSAVRRLAFHCCACRSAPCFLMKATMASNALREFGSNGCSLRKVWRATSRSRRSISPPALR